MKIKDCCKITIPAMKGICPCGEDWSMNSANRTKLYTLKCERCQCVSGIHHVGGYAFWWSINLPVPGSGKLNDGCCGCSACPQMVYTETDDAIQFSHTIIRPIPSASESVYKKGMAFTLKNSGATIKILDVVGDRLKISVNGMESVISESDATKAIRWN